MHYPLGTEMVTKQETDIEIGQRKGLSEVGENGIWTRQYIFFYPLNKKMRFFFSEQLDIGKLQMMYCPS